MSYYDEEGFRQSRRIHGLGVQSPTEPMPYAAPTTNAQPTPPVNDHTKQQTATASYTTGFTGQTEEQEFAAPLIDLLSDDGFSLETQSYHTDTPNHPLPRQQSFMSPVPPPYPPRQSPSPSSGSVTSVYVQADPPSQHANSTPPATQLDEWNTSTNIMTYAPTNGTTVQQATQSQPIVQSTTPTHQQQIEQLQRDQATLQQNVRQINTSIQQLDTTMLSQYNTLMDKLTMLLNTSPNTNNSIPAAMGSGTHVTPRVNNVTFAATTVNPQAQTPVNQPTASSSTQVRINQNTSSRVNTTNPVSYWDPSMGRAPIGHQVMNPYNSAARQQQSVPPTNTTVPSSTMANASTVRGTTNPQGTSTYAHHPTPSHTGVQQTTSVPSTAQQSTAPNQGFQPPGNQPSVAPAQSHHQPSGMHAQRPSMQPPQQPGPPAPTPYVQPTQQQPQFATYPTTVPPTQTFHPMYQSTPFHMAPSMDKDPTWPIYKEGEPFIDWLDMMLVTASSSRKFQHLVVYLQTNVAIISQVSYSSVLVHIN